MPISFPWSSTDKGREPSDSPQPSRQAAPEGLRILVVDDDLMHARLIRSNLQRPGRIDVEVAGSAEDALEQLGLRPFDAVVTDLMMPGMDGLELVKRIRETDASLPVVIMTAHATLERAVEGIRAGATEFLPKPINLTALLALVERAVRERPLREEIIAQQERRSVATTEGHILGSHPSLKAVREVARQIAQAPYARVLITGESGTGKSLLARAIHEMSGASGRFVEVNCAALPPQLLESELFGHEKGAFTDAKALKRGLIELAEKGTLFLDEIGTMPLDLQAKLLLVLENREIRRVGGADPIPVRTRVIAATNEDLRQRVRERTFRQDLLYRLDVASVEMPPLREMPSVIPELAERFLRELCEELHRPLPRVGERSFARLTEYPWPGNSRELRNAVERALIFHSGGEFVAQPPATPGEPLPADSGINLGLGLTLEEVERRYLAATLESTTRDLTEIAAQLGISRKTLWEKRRRYGL